MIFIICNPVAGSGRGEKIGAQVEATLKEKGIPCQLHKTEKRGDAMLLARQARDAEIETVLSVGGDGTTLGVARGLVGGKTALGIIPAGTGNDFIKTLKIPKDPAAALEHMLSHAPQATDVGEINGKLFLNEIGTGFDVAVLDATEKFKKFFHGLLPYLLGLLQALFSFRPIPITYAVDGGKETTKDAFVIAAANGGIIGGGIPVAPDARVDDGLMDIVVVGKIKWYRLPARLLGLMRGKIRQFPETFYCRAASLEFSCKQMRVNTDGEITSEDSVTARILPGKLQIYR